MPGTPLSARSPCRNRRNPHRPSFSHDLTAKSIFAEPEAARDLVALLAARECPELQGWTPVRLVAGSAVTADPERRPPQSEGHRDLVWELARADDGGARMLLHLEFQAQRDAEMSERMFLYALHISPSLRGLEICGVVVNTGVDRFGEWRRPVQTVAGVHRYGFRAGALLEIHDHAVPGLPRVVNTHCRRTTWPRASWRWRGCRRR